MASLSAASGAGAGGHSISTMGTGLSTASAIHFAPNSAVPTVVSDSLLNVTVPTGTAGTAGVTVTGGTQLRPHLRRHRHRDGRFHVRGRFRYLRLLIPTRPPGSGSQTTRTERHPLPLFGRSPSHPAGADRRPPLTLGREVPQTCRNSPTRRPQ
ncbi:IPT/TIG domain-containing protein [Streptomyces sp. NPDC048411]|uniref:IPT/TIG domain-containing protein n=1 Tax=Streptomyces sp. NPDC048411 TaxID=3157206 RepID=UPI003451C5A3